MKLFKTYEFELKTNRAKDSVIKDLSTRATFDKDEFRIKSEIFSLRRGSYVTGRVFDNGQNTTVSVKIYPSADYKGVAVMWFGFLSIFMAVFLIQQLSMGQFSLWILAFPLFGLFGYFMIRLFYWFSVEMQRYSIIGLIS